jgi:hypothetical protein
MPLCALTDMEALLQNNITNPVDPMALTLLDLASLAIEAEVGRDLEATALTGILRTMDAGNNGVLLTDDWPLASIEAVTENAVVLVLGTDYLEDLELGAIRRINSNGAVIPWLADPQTISLDYTRLTPGVARTECARIAADAFIGGANFAARSSIAGGAMLALRQLTIGRWSATSETGAGSGTTGVVIDELARTRLASIVDRRP